MFWIVLDSSGSVIYIADIEQSWPCAEDESIADGSGDGKDAGGRKSMETSEYAIDFNVYPVPTRDFITVEMSPGLMDELEMIVVTDLQGRTVLESVDWNHVQISHLAPGQYLVRIKTYDGFIPIARRIIID